MSIISFDGKTPVIGKNCFVADSAQLIGDVTLKDGASVWYGAVLRGDVSPIVIGENSNVQDNAVLHGESGDPCFPVILGDRVTVGHSAVVHACVVEDNCLIGMGSVVLDKAHIGHGSIVAAGAVVSPGKEIPPLSQVMGIPGTVAKTLAPETEQDRINHADRYHELALFYLKK